MTHDHDDTELSDAFGGLPKRAKLALQRAGLTSPEALADTPIHTLRALDGIEAGDLEIIRVVLAKRGMQLREQ